MTFFKVILTIFLVVVIKTKGHITFIKGCANLFSKTFPRTNHFLVSAYNHLIHLYKCTPKKIWFILFVSIGILFAGINFGFVVFFICGVAGLSLWLGYKAVQAIQSWFRFSFGPTTVPMYAPPKDFSAAQIHFIINDKWTKDNTCIALIQMTLNGFLELTSQKTHTPEGFEILTYTFTRTAVSPKNEDEFLYDNIIGPDSSLTLNNAINPALDYFNKELAELTIQKTKETIYYKHRFQKYFMIATLCCIPILFVLHHLPYRHSDWIRLADIAFMVIATIGFYVSKNKKHPIFKEIAGLKMFLKAVCKNEHLNISSSSIKDVLPYALAMDIPKAWDKLISSLKTKNTSLLPLFQPNFKQLISNAVKDIEQ